MRRGQSRWLAARGFFKSGASGLLGGETNCKCEPFLVAEVIEHELKSKLPIKIAVFAQNPRDDCHHDWGRN